MSKLWWGLWTTSVVLLAMGAVGAARAGMYFGYGKWALAGTCADAFSLTFAMQRRWQSRRNHIALKGEK